MLNPRITIIGNWDETFSVTLDGEIVYDRHTRAECEARAAYLDAKLSIDTATPDVP